VAGKWNNIGLDVGGLQSGLESAVEVLDVVVQVLNAIKSAVRAIELFVINFESVLKALISAIITLIEQSLLQILETSAYLGVYSNLQVNKDWGWVQTPNSEAHPNAAAGDAPFNGNGMSGWLGSMLASTFDESNPLRPITDTATAVSGLIFVVGGPTFNEIKDLLPLLSRLFNFDDFSNAILSQDDLEELEAKNRWQILGGYCQTRAAKLAEGFGEAKSALEETSAQIEESLSDPFPPVVDILQNSPGPSWVGLPFAACFGEPVRQLATALRGFVNSFSFADTPLTQLLNAITAKIQQIEEAIAFLRDVLASLSALLELLEGGQWYVANEDAGGAVRFFASAASAENVPNYGSNGAVIGFSALTTSASAHSFESLLDLFGVNVSQSFTAAAEAGEAVVATPSAVSDAFDFSGIEWQE
jgi:hypothetical protein